MKNKIKTPRILKILRIKDFTIYCVFNNGETRVIDFLEIFKMWKLSKRDPEYILLKQSEFKKVALRNNTLSWKNIQIELIDLKGNKISHPFELSPDLLFKYSHPLKNDRSRFFFGSIIRDAREVKGITQKELAELSGTSKSYISRVESDLIEPELTTLYKILEIGLGKKIKVLIE